MTTETYAVATGKRLRKGMRWTRVESGLTLAEAEVRTLALRRELGTFLVTVVEDSKIQNGVWDGR